MELYTDGSCLKNPGCGGWACVTKNKFQICGGDKETTNNIMELTAVINGLEKCLDIGEHEVTVFTDSKYVKNGITQWIHSWISNNWMTSQNQPVKNKKLWKKLYEISKKINSLKWEWVKAHDGNELNEKADKLARRTAELISQY